MLEFAHIARPVETLQFLDVGQRESWSPAAQLAGEAGQEVFGQQRNVLNAFGSGGNSIGKTLNR